MAADGAPGANGNGDGSPTIDNRGVLAGGIGGDGTDGGTGGRGGIGALVTGGGASANSGFIVGGNGGVASPRGVGGAGGVGAYFAANGAEFLNTGTVFGGAGGGGGGVGGAGGVAAYFAGTGAAFVNRGAVAGGIGGLGFCCFPRPAGGNGGAGVYFAGRGAFFVNDGGAVTGGTGGGGGFFGGAGGAGAYFAEAGATFLNMGTVAGGAGGGGFFGGGGGAGVIFAGAGAVFINAGTVTGGTAASGFLRGAPGGVGVIGNGLTIINSGTISGGLSGDGTTRANAIEFRSGVNTLEIWSGSRIIGNVVGTGSDTLRLGGAADGSFDVSALGAQYQGFSDFRKRGSSFWTLTGISDWAGNTSVDSGGLIVNGSLANSRFTVNRGALLAGVGAVGDLTVAGAFAPGSLNAPGTMTVRGDLTFQQGAAFLVQISRDGASRADVSGAASLAGTVYAAFTPESLSRRALILHADGGVTGRFAEFRTNFTSPNFYRALAYGARDVYIDTTATLGAGLVLSGNQFQVASAVNAWFNAGGALTRAFGNIFGSTGASLAGALTSLSGEAATGAQYAAFRSTDQFLGTLFDPALVEAEATTQASAPPLAYAPPRAPLNGAARALDGAVRLPERSAASYEAKRWSSWARSFGAYGRTGGDPAGAGSHSVTTSTFGVGAGVDYLLTPGVRVGAALAGGGLNWSLARGLGGGGGDNVQTAVYASARSGPAYVFGAFAFANSWLSLSRMAAFGDSLASRYAAQTYGGRFESGYRLSGLALGLAPYAAFQGLALETPAHVETDQNLGGFGLAYRQRSASWNRSEAGVRIERVFPVGWGMSLALRGRAAWAHNWVSDPSLKASFQALPGAAFAVIGAMPVKDSALVTSLAELRLADGAFVGLRFDGDLAPRSQTYMGSAQLRYEW